MRQLHCPAGWQRKVVLRIFTRELDNSALTCDPVGKCDLYKENMFWGFFPLCKSITQIQ